MNWGGGGGGTESEELTGVAQRLPPSRAPASNLQRDRSLSCVYASDPSVQRHCDAVASISLLSPLFPTVLPIAHSVTRQAPHSKTFFIHFSFFFFRTVFFQMEIFIATLVENVQQNINLCMPSALR